MARESAAQRFEDAWEAAEAKLKEISKRGNVFVRLEDDGDSVVGAFVGVPRVREVHWTGTAYVDCIGERCKGCEAGARLGAKVMINFYVAPTDDEDGAMKVFEANQKTYSLIIKRKRKYGLNRWFEIERDGEKGDTKTTYSIVPLDAMSKAEIAAIGELPLHDLYKLGSDDFPKDDDAEEPKKRSKRTEREDDDERPRSRRPARIERTREAAPEPEPDAPEPEPDPESAPAPRPRARVARPAVVTPPPAAAGDDFNPFG